MQLKSIPTTKRKTSASGCKMDNEQRTQNGLRNPNDIAKILTGGKKRDFEYLDGEMWREKDIRSAW